jgi:hypothetical protein
MSRSPEESDHALLVGPNRPFGPASRRRVAEVVGEVRRIIWSGGRCACVRYRPAVAQGVYAIRLAVGPRV